MATTFEEIRQEFQNPEQSIQARYGNIYPASNVRWSSFTDKTVPAPEVFPLRFRQIPENTPEELQAIAKKFQEQAPTHFDKPTQTVRDFNKNLAIVALKIEKETGEKVELATQEAPSYVSFSQNYPSFSYGGASPKEMAQNALSNIAEGRAISAAEKEALEKEKPEIAKKVSFAKISQGTFQPQRETTVSVTPLAGGTSGQVQTTIEKDYLGEVVSTKEETRIPKSNKAMEQSVPLPLAEPRILPLSSERSAAPSLDEQIISKLYTEQPLSQEMERFAKKIPSNPLLAEGMRKIFTAPSGKQFEISLIEEKKGTYSIQAKELAKPSIEKIVLPKALGKQSVLIGGEAALIRESYARQLNGYIAPEFEFEPIPALGDAFRAWQASGKKTAELYQNTTIEGINPFFLTGAANIVFFENWRTSGAAIGATAGGFFGERGRGIGAQLGELTLGLGFVDFIAGPGAAIGREFALQSRKSDVGIQKAELLGGLAFLLFAPGIVGKGLSRSSISVKTAEYPTLVERVSSTKNYFVGKASKYFEVETSSFFGFGRTRKGNLLEAELVAKRPSVAEAEAMARGEWTPMRNKRTRLAPQQQIEQTKITGKIETPKVLPEPLKTPETTALAIRKSGELAKKIVEVGGKKTKEPSTIAGLPSTNVKGETVVSSYRGKITETKGLKAAKSLLPAKKNLGGIEALDRFYSEKSSAVATKKGKSIGGIGITSISKKVSAQTPIGELTYQKGTTRGVDVFEKKARIKKEDFEQLALSQKEIALLLTKTDKGIERAIVFSRKKTQPEKIKTVKQVKRKHYPLETTFETQKKISGSAWEYTTAFPERIQELDLSAFVKVGKAKKPFYAVAVGEAQKGFRTKIVSIEKEARASATQSLKAKATSASGLTASSTAKGKIVIKEFKPTELPKDSQLFTTKMGEVLIVQPKTKTVSRVFPSMKEKSFVAIIPKSKERVAFGELSEKSLGGTGKTKKIRASEKSEKLVLRTPSIISSQEKTKTLIVPISATRQIVGRATRKAVKEAQRTRTRTQTITIAPEVPIFETPRPPRTPIGWPPHTKGKERLPKKLRKLLGFDVFVRRRGKFKKANPFALTKSAAYGLGARITSGTAAATFFVKPSKQSLVSTIQDDYFQRVAGKYYRKGSELIEKTLYRINTPGEFRQITAKGIEANRRRFVKKFL